MTDEEKTAKQEEDRADLLQGTIDSITSYFLDHCPDNENWENFDPNLDTIRSELQELQEGKTLDEVRKE